MSGSDAPADARRAAAGDALAVHVAAPDAWARAGLEALLERLGLAVVAREEADVLVWDAAGGGLLPDAPVVALVLDDEGAEEALASGARGVLPRDADPERLAAALRAVAAGLYAIDPAFRPTWGRRPVRAPTEGLTARESEVIELLAEGLSNKQIAVRLHISEHTAKFHVVAILDKLGAASRTEAVVLAARAGLLML